MVHIPPCCMFSVCLLHCSPDGPPQCVVACQLPGTRVRSLFWCYVLQYCQAPCPLKLHWLYPYLKTLANTL
jgi:hypothetical protein